MFGSAGARKIRPTAASSAAEKGIKAMKRFAKVALGALMMAGAATATTLATTGPADARVSIGIGIGIPGPGVYEGYYGPGYYPPGPCGGYNYYYSGYCGYPVYDGPVWFDGAWYRGPHYYRWYGGQPWVWAHGGWHGGYRGGWHGRR
jgi:hypothetical protein